MAAMRGAYRRPIWKWQEWTCVLRCSLIRLLELSHQVDDLLIAVHDDEVNKSASSNAAQTDRLRSAVRRYARPEPARIYLAVYRLDDSVYYSALQVESFRMRKALADQMLLDQVFDIAFAGSAMTEHERLIATQQWFANWAELGWFCRPRPKAS
jgi:hypothetical protein